MLPHFKDLFSAQSGDYARFRPDYPSELFDYLASIAPSRGAAWDAGTGNGQAALALAERFDCVLATDPSEKQLALASPHARIRYERSAESSSAATASLDLITVAQAFHWFNFEVFFAEARRVLKPGGILALWCYELCAISPEIDRVVFKLYREILGSYWEEQRKLVEEGYRGVPIPFEELIAPPDGAVTEMKADWSLEHLLGYLGTWSALQAYQRKNDRDPRELVYEELSLAWGSPALRQVVWPLSLRLARKSD